MSLKDLFTGNERIISSGTGHTRSDWLNLKSNMGAHTGTEIQGFNYTQSSGGKAKKVAFGHLFAPFASLLVTVGHFWSVLVTFPPLLRHFWSPLVTFGALLGSLWVTLSSLLGLRVRTSFWDAQKSILMLHLGHHFGTKTALFEVRNASFF